MDPIADMLIRIKNAARARVKSVTVPYSEIKFQIASILMKGGFLEDVQRKTRKSGKHAHKNLEMTIAYSGETAKVHDVRRVSKVSRRVYVPKTELYPVKGGFGLAVVSTSKGVMSDKEARKSGIGGEVIAEIW